ncbi:MAG: GNAT family N-acetyltransferase [Ruminococcaceae bacterium]|nr:GNAT family N-acetyltransferase [Oscillospiraceae bacterium]
MSKFEFMNDFNFLSDGEITLKILQKYNGDDELLPFYYYEIFIDDTPVGKISIRIGSNYHSYYNGNIGYEIDKGYRGNHYSYKACKLVFHVAKAHGMNELIITCDESNIASYKTIEKLGAELIETVKPPEDYFAYREDMEKQKIYKLHIK